MEKAINYVLDYRVWGLPDMSSRESIKLDGKRYVVVTDSEVSECKPKVHVIRNLYRISDGVSVKIYA